LRLIVGFLLVDNCEGCQKDTPAALYVMVASFILPADYYNASFRELLYDAIL